MRVFADRESDDGFVLRWHSPSVREGFDQGQKVEELLPAAYRFQKLTMARNARPGQSRAGNRVSVTMVVRYRGEGDTITLGALEARLDLQS